MQCEGEAVFKELSAPYRVEAMRLMRRQEDLYHAAEAGWISDDELQAQHQELQDRLDICKVHMENMNREFVGYAPANYSLDF